MNVLGLRWVGIRSPEYEPMVRLLRDVMGLRVEFSEDTTAELSLSNGDRVQVLLSLSAPRRPAGAAR